jgi:hypothetical protein
MNQSKIAFTCGASVALFLSLVVPVWAQVEVGDYRISGSAEVGGLPRTFKGDKASFETYREHYRKRSLWPELQLKLESKKKIIISILTLTKPVSTDQSYNRASR